MYKENNYSTNCTEIFGLVYNLQNEQFIDDYAHVTIKYVEVNKEYDISLWNVKK